MSIHIRTAATTSWFWAEWFGAAFSYGENRPPIDRVVTRAIRTQQELARALNVDQSAVSKLGRRTDMYVSTLRRCIVAMGGQLEIRAIFPEGIVRINQFERIAADE